MKNYKIIILIIVFFITNTCFSQELTKSSTKLNENITVEIGDVVFFENEIIKTKAIKIVKSYTQKSGFIKFKHFQNSRYPFQFSKKNFDFYYSKENRKDGRYWGVAVNSNKITESYPALISSLSKITKIQKKHPISNKIKPDYIISSCKECYRQELIYNGKSGQTLKFTYREYINDLARPVFFQHLEYDLSEDNIIGYKGARIKIFKASNISLNFKIIRGFE